MRFVAATPGTILWLVYLVVCTACTYARTQTVVEIRADRLVEVQATELRVEIRDAADALLVTRSINPQALDFVGFPLLIPISARNGDATRRFEIRITALQSRRIADGSVNITTLAQNRMRTSFLRGQVPHVTLWLLSNCRCNPETERCVPDADQDLVPECENIEYDLRQNRDGGLDSEIVVDAGEDAGDASSNPDGNACTSNQHMCNGQCVSRLSPLFCGAECASCAQVPGGESRCTGDQCEVVCDLRTPDRCTDNGVLSACVDLMTDRRNCNTCGNVCPGNQLCQNRACVEPPQCDPADSICTGMTYCDPMTRRCVPGCASPAQCRSDQMCNIETHTCDCRSDLLSCGDACVTCPSGGAIRRTECANNACVVAECEDGWQINGTRSGCQDIDECMGAPCTAPATCVNTPAGSYTCRCSSPNRRCGGGCVTCPNDPNALDTECNMERCQITACRPGYSRNQERTACIPDATTAWTLQPNRSLTTRPTGTGTPYGMGRSIAVSQNGLLLAVGDRSYGAGLLGGVHIFTRPSATSSFAAAPAQTINAPSMSEDFGVAVALSGDGMTLYVGDREYGVGVRGAVHIYTRPSSTSSFPVTPTTTVTGPASSRDFGMAVACSRDGSTLLVGDMAFGVTPDMGAVHVFSVSGGVSLSQTLSSTTTRLGFSVAISDDLLTLYAGEPKDAAVPGIVSIFTRVSSAVPFAASSQTITAPANSLRFGSSLAVSANNLMLVVGDWDFGASMAGGVHVFTRSSTSMSFVGLVPQLLTAPSMSTEFGISAALPNGDRELFIGDDGTSAGSGPGTGAVWMFTR